MLIEWYIYVVDRIRRKIGHDRFEKFINRFLYEFDKLERSAYVGADALINISEVMRAGHETSEGTIEVNLDKDMIETLKKACWYCLILNLCVKDDNVEMVSAWASRSLQELNKLHHT